MNVKKQNEKLDMEKIEFYAKFEAAFSSEIEREGGQMEILYTKDNTVAAYSARFWDCPIAVTAYPDLLYTHWTDGIKIPTLVNEVMRAVSQEKPLDFTQCNIKKENASTHLKASMVNFEECKEWLKNVPYERYKDAALVADWHFDDGHKIAVHNNMLSLLQMTREEVLAQSKLNAALDLSSYKALKSHTEETTTLHDIHKHRRSR